MKFSEHGMLSHASVSLHSDSFYLIQLPGQLLTIVKSKCAPGTGQCVLPRMNQKIEGRGYEVIFAAAKAVVSYSATRFQSGRRSVPLKRFLGKKKDRVIASILITHRAALYSIRFSSKSLQNVY